MQLTIFIAAQNCMRHCRSGKRRLSNVLTSLNAEAIEAVQLDLFQVRVSEDGAPR